jgi:hypothetical protein
VTVPLAERPTALYRLFDRADRLLYIGIAHNPPLRWVTHAAQKTWWPDVARTEISWFSSRPDAEAAEVLAIEDERPLHNVLHNGEEERSLTTATVAVPASAPDRAERVWTSEMEADMIRLRAAAAAVAGHDDDRRKLADAIVYALSVGVRPSEVDAVVPYDRNHVRRIAKKAGIPALRNPTGGHDRSPRSSS